MLVIGMLFLVGSDLGRVWKVAWGLCCLLWLLGLPGLHFPECGNFGVGVLCLQSGCTKDRRLA